MSDAFVSDYAKTGNGARVYMPLIGTINVNGTQVFVHDRTYGLLALLKFDSTEDAELEMAGLTEQLDAWEVYQDQKKGGGTRNPNRR